jgi:hypothetical protein
LPVGFDAAKDVSVTAKTLVGIVSHFDRDPGLLGNLAEDGAQRFECGLLDAGKIDARRPCRGEGGNLAVGRPRVCGRYKKAPL